MAKLHQGVWGEQKDEHTLATVKAALESGINFFDNAEMYGNGYAEEVTGRALRASGFPRESYYIATKVSESNLSASLVREHAQASIDRMSCKYLDLYQLHWASRAAVRTSKYPERPLEEEVPLEETLLALNELREKGKIRNIGVCNFGVHDLKRALATGIPIASNQICYNLLWRGIEAEVIPFCINNDVAILPWSAMGQGLLTGKYQHADNVPAGRQRSRLFCGSGQGARPQQRHGEPGFEKETFAAIDKFRWIAEHLIPAAKLEHVALAWLRQQPAVKSVLMGARNPAQLKGNLQCLDLTLQPTEVALLNDAGDELKRNLGHENLDPYEGADSSRIW